MVAPVLSRMIVPLARADQGRPLRKGSAIVPLARAGQGRPLRRERRPSVDFAGHLDRRGLALHNVPSN